MSDLDEIRKRMQKRKGTKYPLNDDNFKRFYNFMIKFMVVILVVLVSMSYVKLNPNTKIKDLVLNDANYKKLLAGYRIHYYRFYQMMQLLHLVK